jgi:putative SOS response-associated peptidase YedK
MCGKFTAMGRWRKVWDFSQPLTVSPADPPDEEVTYGVAQPLPVIVWNRETKERRVVPMRWGFPHPKDWRRPQPMHARSETIDIKEPFVDAFHDGQRGIVVFKTFNEGEEIPKPSGKTDTIQWTIDPLDGLPRGFAFVWRRYKIPGLPQPLLTCAMVTVPASELVRAKIAYNQDDPRMPAILDDADWETWLGQNDTTSSQVKAVLKTVEGVNWKAEPEPKKQKAAKKPKAEKTEPQPELF